MFTERYFMEREVEPKNLIFVATLRCAFVWLRSTGVAVYFLLRVFRKKTFDFPFRKITFDFYRTLFYGTHLQNNDNERYFTEHPV